MTIIDKHFLKKRRFTRVKKILKKLITMRVICRIARIVIETVRILESIFR